MILQKRPSAAAIGDLVATLLRHTAEGRERSPIPQIHVARSSKPTRPMPVLYEPALVVVAQGKKLVGLGEDEITYDASSYLLNSVALPILGHVVTATHAKPYVSVRIPLHPDVIGPVLKQAALSRERAPRRASRCVRSTLPCSMRCSASSRSPTRPSMRGPARRREADAARRERLLREAVCGEQGFARCRDSTVPADEWAEGPRRLRGDQ